MMCCTYFNENNTAHGSHGCHYIYVDVDLDINAYKNCVFYYHNNKLRGRCSPGGGVCSLIYNHHFHTLTCSASSTSLRATSARDWSSVQVSHRLWSSLSWTEAASSSWERSSSSSLVRASTLICVKTKQKVNSVNLPHAFVLDKTENNSTSAEVTSPAPALCNGPLLSTSARPPGLQLTAQPAGWTPCQTKLFSLPPSEKGPGKREKVC